MKHFSPFRTVDAEGFLGATALYRHFDGEGRLLYVGISLSAVARLKQHQGKSEWFTKIRNVTIEWHPSRDAALMAEAYAIKTEKPIHNVIGTCLGSSLSNADRDALAERVRRIEVRRLIIPNVDWTWLQEISNKTGRDVDSLFELMVDGLLPMKLKVPSAKGRKPLYIRKLLNAGVVLA